MQNFKTQEIAIQSLETQLRALAPTRDDQAPKLNFCWLQLMLKKPPISKNPYKDSRLVFGFKFIKDPSLVWSTVQL